MDSLLLHPRTRAELTAMAADPPHSLLLVAPHGSGKLAIAQAWAALITRPTLISIVAPDDKETITIEAVRTLYQRTRNKQPGRQIVIIDHAEAMGSEAQNAFLKLLEEPRQNVTFILTASSTQGLLSTIISRVQAVELLPLTNQTLTEYAARLNIDSQTLAQLLFVADGRAATFIALTTNKDAFDKHKATMRLAKELLGASSYERLTHVPNLCKDRSQAIATLEAMAFMLGQYIRKAPSEALVRFADALQECLARLQQNGNLRAQLTHLFMQ